jgi:hypothetical protein
MSMNGTVTGIPDDPLPEADLVLCCAMFSDLYPDVGVPKTAWRWVESAQYRLLRAGAHRALSCVDLLICACAAVHRLVILHDDNDFAVAARHLPDLAVREVRTLPGLS